MPVASAVATASARSSSTPSAGSATKMTSTSRHVVQLAAAGLAHADHGEPGVRGTGAVLLPGDGQAGLQGRLGEPRQLLRGSRHVPHRVRRREVEGGDPEQLAPVGDAQGVVCGPLAPFVRPDGGDQALPQTGGAGRGRVGHAAPVVGMPDEVVDQGDRPTEDGDQPVARRAGPPERDEQIRALVIAVGDRAAVLGEVLGAGPRSAVAQRLHQPDEPQQRLVGVRGRAEGVGQPVVEDVVERVGKPGERSVLQQRLGPAGVGEAEPGELPTGRRGPRRHRPAAARGAAGSGRARTGSPGYGSPPTPPACCAGRSRRRARPASRRRARCAP